MKHLMIDLETMGTQPDAVILTIGAVFFDPDENQLGEQFYTCVDLQSSLDAGRTIDASTLKWWFTQGEEAQQELFSSMEPMPLLAALVDFTEFCAKGGNALTPWSNGLNFDVALLENALSAAGLEMPWKFWNLMDVRTIKKLAENKVQVSDFPFGGVKHNALHDAIHQAEYVSAMWRELR